MIKINIELPVSGIVFTFTEKGLFIDGKLLDSSITYCLPNTVKASPKYLNIVTNLGYCRITDTGISVLDLSEAVF